MMKFAVSTPYGIIYQDSVDYVVVYNEDGQTGILSNHMPIVIHVDLGYIKLTKAQRNVFVYVEHAVVKFKNNELVILAMEAQIGKTIDKARNAFLDEKNLKIQSVKRENVDYSRQEKELRENISKSKAGSVL